MDNHTYIKILQDTLIKKDQILEELLQLTIQQENVLINKAMDYEVFEICISRKEVFINQLNQLDDGFGILYERVREELSDSKDKYKDQIIAIQQVIKDIISKSTKLQVMENKNKLSMELFLSDQKKDVRSIKMNNKMATNYYSNMSGKNLNESFFFDKKK